MKVFQLAALLKNLPQNAEIEITNMTDHFCESNFEVKSYLPENGDDENYTAEIIMNNYSDIA